MAEMGREDVKRKLLSFSQDCKGKRNQFMILIYYCFVIITIIMYVIIHSVSIIITQDSDL